MSEDLFKENIEKSKKVLKEHFERRKQEREMKRDLWRPELYSILELHIGENWDTDDEEFDDFTKERDSFYERLVWDDPLEKEKKFITKCKKCDFKDDCNLVPSEDCWRFNRPLPKLKGVRK